jgi:formate dehydrogenase (coenzyme F420) alpha subunit
MSEKRVEQTICLFCPPGCGINVEIENNVPVNVESNPDSVVGPICIKGEVIPEWYQTELKNRLLHPMLKVRAGWEKICWDTALDIMAEKLTTIKENCGPEALAVYLGTVADLHDLTYYAKRFCMGFGSPSLYSVNSTCYWGKVIAGIMTYGTYAPPVLLGSKCIILWAANPTESVPFAGNSIVLGKTKGVKLITVDPRRTLLAKASDLHLQLRPGTDGALALGMLNVIISEKLYDEKFVENWVLGLDKLATRCEEFTPEKVEQITWVPADKIRAAARLYATSKPAAIFQGNCLDNIENGFYACRAIDTLVAITGNLDVRGGSTLIPAWNFAQLAERGMPESAMPKLPAAGDERWPLMRKCGGMPAGAGLADAILTGKPYPIKALVTQRANPLLSWADTNKLKRALERLDFLVVMDIFMTETAQMADLVLPAANLFLEQQLIYQYVGRPLLVMLKKLIEPPEECWPDWKLWFELGKRLGSDQYMPWKTIDEAQSEVLAADLFNLSLNQMKENPNGVFFSPRTWKKYENVPDWKFDTPSGKVEVYSEQLAEMGYDPLPGHAEPFDSPVSNPGLVKHYPLICNTGQRSLYYLHGMHRSTPTLRGRYPEPMAEINTETARELGIESGDMVIVETTRGMIQLKAAVTADIHRNVVSVPHEWGGLANGNLLTNDDVHDPIWGGLKMRALACRVKKVPVSQAPGVRVVG